MLIIAHRAAPENSGFQENSLQAVKRCHEKNYDGFEIDLRTNYKNELIVAHDPYYIKNNQIIFHEKQDFNEKEYVKNQTKIHNNTKPEPFEKYFPYLHNKVVLLETKTLKAVTKLIKTLKPQENLYLMSFDSRAMQLAEIKDGIVFSYLQELMETQPEIAVQKNLYLV